MPHVVITGGPGAGKTSLLTALADLGYKTVQESARAVIAERLAAGKTARPEPQDFALEILRRDIDKFTAIANSAEWVFFDRGVIEAIKGAIEVGALLESEVNTMVGSFPFHPLVFILPPWQAIYVTDTERDHTFDHSVKVHKKLVHWYSSCGYQLHEVPYLPVSARASHVLDTITSQRLGS